MNIVKIIGEVCDNVGSVNSYIYGSLQEVVVKLSQMSKTQATAAKKYPLIALVTDIRETDSTRPDIDKEPTIESLIICTYTKQSYMADERADNTFVTLEAIYESFMTELKKHKLVNCYDYIPHVKVRRYSWGKSALFTEAGISTDFIDAIEIQNLQLSIFKEIC